MLAPDPRGVAEAWLRRGLPSAISGWLAKLSAGPRSAVYLSRAHRFVAFAEESSEQEDALQKAWTAVCRSAPASSVDRDPAELAIFMQLPDREEYNPHALLYGGRRLDRTIVAQERRRYAQLRKNVAAVRTALTSSPLRDRPKPLSDLLQDALASGATSQAAAFRRDHLDPLIHGLRALDDLLGQIDPADKVPTAQFAADTAARMVFVNQVANLNRHLTKPRHAALVTLATVNCTSAVLTAAQVGKAWSRMDKQA